MDRPERTQATGDAGRGQSTPGAAPQPVQAAFRNRQVTEMPAAGPSPSRTELQATHAGDGASGSRRVSVIRVVRPPRRAVQPYTVGEPGRRPGASLPPAREPSVSLVQQGSGRQRKFPAHRPLITAYEGIAMRSEIEMRRGNSRAAAACTSARREIEQAVTDALASHRLRVPELSPQNTSESLTRLKAMLRSAKQHANQPRAEGIQRSLDDIYRLIQAKSTQLEERSAGSHSASLPHADSVSDRAAHERVVQAIASGSTHRPAEPGGTQLSTHPQWKLAHDAIVARFHRDWTRGDFDATTASASALCDINGAITNAYYTHRLRRTSLDLSNTADVMQKLLNMRHWAKYIPDQHRVEAIEKSLDDIHRLTHVRLDELNSRDNELSSAAPFHTNPVRGREALGRWLLHQVHASRGTRVVHAYFIRLSQEFSLGRDSWTVSRSLMQHLPNTGNEAERLRAAHGRLVQAMAGSPPQQVTVRPPVVAQAYGGIRASTSTQQ